MTTATDKKKKRVNTSASRQPTFTLRYEMGRVVVVVVMVAVAVVAAVVVWWGLKLKCRMCAQQLRKVA